MDTLPHVAARVNCRGVDANGKPCFSKPIVVSLSLVVYHCGWDASVECPYNTGSHGQRCRASHPGHEKLGEGVPCTLVGHASAPGAMVTDPYPNEG
jgi:hypothetical protein